MIARDTWWKCILGEQQMMEEVTKVVASAIRKIRIIRRDLGKRQSAK